MDPLSSSVEINMVGGPVEAAEPSLEDIGDGAFGNTNVASD